MTVAALPIPPALGIRPEIAVAALPNDERVWVPQAEGVWFRPLLLNTVSGGWCNLLRVRRAGVLSRHRHPMAVRDRNSLRTFEDRSHQLPRSRSVQTLVEARG